MGAGVGVATGRRRHSRIIYRDPARNILGPQWSPDGQRIIFGLGVFNAFFNGFQGLFLKPAIAPKAARRSRSSTPMAPASAS